MARFVVIVIVLTAIALLVNKFLLHDGDPMPADAAKPAAEAAKTAEAPKAAESAAPAAVVVPAVKKAEAPAADNANEAAAEPAKPPAPADADVLEGPVPAAVVLGDDSLAAGIPGSGDLTVEQVDAWLADALNHVSLKVELPEGLKAGAAEIKGLDQNPLTRAKIELGRQLYFDGRLSSDGTISCASCHDPSYGFAKDTQFGVGVDGQQGARNSPVAYNRILSGPQFWDGRAKSLEDQAVGPIANAIEMGNTHEACVASLSGIPLYVAQFAAIFPDGLTIENVGRALASFERTLVTGPAPWDVRQQLKSFETAYAVDIEDLDALKSEDAALYGDYMKLKAAAEASPLSEAAERGGALFFSDKAGCTACHLGANFTDEKFHNLGVGMAAEKPDLGRFDQTKEEKDRGAFKTPTCRNVAMSGPYMHDGSQKTLEDVVEWYAKGGHPNATLDEKVKKLDLTAQDKADLVAFMKDGLTGRLPKVEKGRLPQ